MIALGRSLRRRRTAHALVTLVLATALVGCAGITAGTAVPAARAAVSSSPVPSGTDPTAAPTTTGPALVPLTEIGPTDEARGRRLEARRLANQIPLLSEIDPTLSLMDFPTEPIEPDRLDDLSGLLSGPQIELLQSNGSVELGFVATRRSDQGDAALALMVLEVDDVEQGAALVAQLLTADPDNVPVTSAVSGAVAARMVNEVVSEVEITLLSGSLVLYAKVVAYPDDDGLPLADQGVQALVDAMGDFRVTPAAERLALPSDFDGLSAHTLPGKFGPAAVHTAHAALHYQYDQGPAITTFTNAGVDLATLGDVSVYRAADGPRAMLVQAHLLSETAINGSYTEAVVDGMPPTTRCTQEAKGSLTCAGSVGRYAFVFVREEPQEAVAVATRQQNLLEQL